jgi:hypothetical protein
LYLPLKVGAKTLDHGGIYQDGGYTDDNAQGDEEGTQLMGGYGLNRHF